ncbi:MAG: polymer-forming cytoskeletal protein [Fibrobacteres bacterium]|nr:polymer-forming cytoskeletal protein [Fibrobacterota bacterium]
MQSKILGTVIGAGTVFDGVLTTNHNIKVEGTLKGRVVVDGDLILEKEGHLDADVEVINAKIAGRVSGKLSAKEKIELDESAQVTGDIHTKDLILNEGAVFKGNCSMVKE